MHGVAAMDAAKLSVAGVNVHAGLVTAVQKDGEQLVEDSQSVVIREEPQSVRVRKRKGVRLASARVFSVIAEGVILAAQQGAQCRDPWPRATGY